MTDEYAFDLYPRDDPRDGARLVRFTYEDFISAEYRDVIGVGAGTAMLSIDHAGAENIDKRGEQYIRVVRLGGTEKVVGGIWTSKLPFETAVANETRRVTLSGPGQMAYLARARMAPHTYVHDVFTGQDPISGVFNLSAQSTVYAGGSYLGAMLWRVLYEAQHFRSGTTPYTHRHADGLTYTDIHDDDRTVSRIPDLVLGFDQFTDSDGNAWTLTAGDFSAQVGDNVLGVVQRLMQAGLFVWMDPDTFTLYAWEGRPASRLGRATDRTGAAWGANVVRFTYPADGTTATGNILSDATRVVNAYLPQGPIWVGADDTYHKEDGPADALYEGYVRSTAEDTTALAAIGATQSTAREEAADVGQLRHTGGNDPANGYYRPGEHYLLDEIVRAHTGTGELDYDEADYPVGAWRVSLPAGSAEWETWAELGASFEEAAERRFSLAAAPTHTHPPNPQLCPARVPASAATVIAGPWTWSEINPENGEYAQTIEAFPSIGQASFLLHNGSNLGSNPFYRSIPAGESLPANAAYVPCTAGVQITIAFDIHNRINSPTPGTATLALRWFDSSSLEIPGSTSIFNDSVGAWTHHVGTATPPTGAVKFQIELMGQLDNVEITSGTGTAEQNPLAGTSNRAARCDHTHVEQMERAPGVEDDAGAGYPVGTFWHNTATDTLYISTDSSDGAAVWVQTSLGLEHATDPDAHLQANYEATAAPTVDDDETEGYAVGSVWVDTTNDNVYIATDVTDGAANWEQVNGGGTETLPESIIDAKGDLIVGDGADSAARLAVGTNGQVLTADSAEATGVKWADPAGGVSSIDDLSDVDTTTTPPSSTDVLAWDGTNWVPTAAGTPGAHASSHEDGGADEIEIANLPTSETDTALVLHPDGAGGVAWGTDATGGGGGLPAAKAWIEDNFDARDYPATSTAYDDEFNDGSGMSGPVNGLNARWGWRNQGGSSVAFPMAGYGSITCAAQSGTNWRILEQALPAGDWTFEALISFETNRTAGGAGHNSHVGLILDDAANGDFYTFGIECASGNLRWNVSRWTNLTTLNAAISNNWGAQVHRAFLQIRKVGTALSFWMSEDGIGWVRVSNTTDAVSPTHIGFALTENVNTGDTKIHVDYIRKIA